MSSGSRETEIKLRINDAAAGARLLERTGLRVHKARAFEANTIFDTPGHDLQRRGAVLRVREYGSEGLVTYKGVADRGRHKSREEIEFNISDASAVVRVLTALGYQPQFRYEKYRTEFTRGDNPGVVTLDETPIGTFFEIEGEPEWIDRLASELGFSQEDYITASYGSLYVAYCRERNVPATNMVF
jgi:adenylate cyclase class 2